MKHEIELSFLGIDVGMTQHKIQQLGGICTLPKTLMQRVVFHHPQKIPGAYMRLRNEGAGKITCTYKQESKTGDILSMQELETTVGNLEEMRSIFLALGILEKAYQETYREIWKIGDVECMIDEWPGLSPFIEIEGPTQKGVETIATQLGFSLSEATYGSVGKKYEKERGIPAEIINSLALITFEHPPKQA